MLARDADEEKGKGRREGRRKRWGGDGVDVEGVGRRGK